MLLSDDSPSKTINFFEQNNIPSEKVTLRRADMEGIDYYSSPLLLNVENKDEDIISKKFTDEFKKNYLDKRKISQKWHHNGPCVVGIKRFFVNSEGNIYPCEKVSSDKASLIGNVNDGINTDKLYNILNVGLLTENECKKCWALRFCNICIQKCIINGCISKDRKLLNCEIQKKEILNYFKNYVISKNLKENKQNE